MKLKKLTFVSMLALSLSSFAGGLKEGSFLGYQNGSNKVHLLLQNAPGRDGSFLALLMKTEKQMSLYLVDEINSNSYSMTPLEVTKDGEIGIVNDDPSLIISMANNSNGEIVFKIMSANSTNKIGFNGYLEFNGKKSRYSWKPLIGGEYEIDGNSRALQISNLDEYEREATSVFMTRSYSGNFKIKEKFPKMFLINQESTFATGTKTNATPSGIGVFIHKDGLICDHEKFVLIDPKNDKNISEFERED